MIVINFAVMKPAIKFHQTIIRAIKANRRLRIGYQKFGAEGYEKTVCPYILRLNRQRWYLIALSHRGQDTL